MGVTVTSPSKTEQLTTLERVRDELALTTFTDDTQLERFIRQASDMVRTWCRRNFGRQAYTELARAYGGPYLVLREAPVVALGTISVDGQVQTDVSIEDRNAGIIYRENGFAWSAQRYGGLVAGGWSLDLGMPIPLQEEVNWSIAYTAGFILPSQNLLGAGTISAASTDNSFNDSASGFPALLKSGDLIETSGFTNAANNGRFLVTGTPTTAKIVVSATLVTEAAASRTVLVQTLPGDVERGCIETVKSLYARRSDDSLLVEKQVGPMRQRFSEDRGLGSAAIPPSAIGLLRDWIRTVA